MFYWFPGRYSILSCARYTVQGELQQVQDRTTDIHVVFLIQLPGIAGGCFTGFQVDIAYCLVLVSLLQMGWYFPCLQLVGAIHIYPARLKLNKRKNKKCHTVGTVSKSNQNFIETGKMYTPNIHIHDRSLSWLGTVKSGRVKLVFCSQTSSLSEMMQSFPHDPHN